MLSLFLASACATPSALVSPTSPPTPDVNAAVQSAVATALAIERAKPSRAPSTLRASWIKSGRELFAIETLATEVRGLALKMLPPNKDDYSYTADKVSNLENRTQLLVLTDDAPESATIRSALNDAIKTQLDLGGQCYRASREKNPQQAAVEVDKALQIASANMKAWGTARQAMIVVLNRYGIDGQDVGLASSR